MMTVRGVPLAAVPRLMHRAGPDFDRPLHVSIAVCDHYEPADGRPGRHVEEARVDRWVNDFPRLAERFRDSAGRCPQHTFFFPIEDAEYDDRHIAKLAEVCRAGFGDVEVHLHHDGETSQQLRELIERRTRRLHEEHGLLARDARGRITYGFIHGNWALDNSRPDGRWCGVNDEITILRETGCYADFTLPSAPSPCQTRTVNSIYYAIDDPQKPNSHDRGVRARVGQAPPPEGLLMIQGPLVWNLDRRKWGLIPGLENGDLTERNAPSLARFRLWCAAGVCVAGREDHLFIKLYTHGAHDQCIGMLLGDPMRRFHADLADFAAQHPQFQYHYVTAREMAERVHDLESAPAPRRQPTANSERPAASGESANGLVTSFIYNNEGPAG